jgi:hypothetical protein
LKGLPLHPSNASFPPSELLGGRKEEARAAFVRGWIMNMANRILLSIAILLVDLGVFFLPLTAFFLIYILVFNPPWFREFLDRLDGRS